MGTDGAILTLTLTLATEEGSSSNVVDKDDDLETVQHVYFLEETTGGTNNGASSVDISDNISEASSCPPVCKNLPSGKNFDPRKKNEFSDTASYQSTLLTRVSHYDQKDPKFDPKNAMGVIMLSMFTKVIHILIMIFKAIYHQILRLGPCVNNLSHACIYKDVCVGALAWERIYAI